MGNTVMLEFWDTCVEILASSIVNSNINLIKLTIKFVMDSS